MDNKEARLNDEVDDLLQQGWGYHDSNSSGLAVELEAVELGSVKLEQAAALLKLSNHTIGEHLGDWPRACVYARRVWQQVDNVQTLLDVAAAIYVAEHLGGDPTAAVNAELTALAAIQPLDPKAVIGVNLQCKVMLAAALIGSDSVQQGSQLYIQVVNLAQKVDGELPCDRSLAITSNNLASELLAVEQRSADEDGLMLVSANAALEFWRRCGTWLNEVRALYLLQVVHNNLQDHQAALSCGEQALAMLSDQGQESESVDEAFVLLAIAASQQQLGLTKQMLASLAQADALAKLWVDADGVDNASLLSSFAHERRKVEPQAP